MSNLHRTLTLAILLIAIAIFAAPALADDGATSPAVTPEPLALDSGFIFNEGEIIPVEDQDKVFEYMCPGQDVCTSDLECERFEMPATCGEEDKRVCFGADGSPCSGICTCCV